MGHKNTAIKSTKPVIAVLAVRTGCGKSQTSRKIIEVLMKQGLKVIAVRHPMPYGDLEAQKFKDLQQWKTLKRTNAQSKKWKNTSRMSVAEM